MTYAALVSKKHKGGSAKKAAKAVAARRPKKKCCVSKPRCTRCPLRMLAEGTLPDGYTVKKRKLVTLDGGKKAPKNTSPDKHKGKGKGSKRKGGKRKGKGKRAAA